MKFYIQTTLTLLIICFIALVTCHKNPTEPKTGTLTGTVLLEGEQDHSGITVALYKLAELDTTILRYNREYPLARRLFGGNVGFFTRRLFGGPISQATEFACPPGVWRNHRFAEVVAESKTNSDGSFKIENISEGLPCEIIECFDINRVETDKHYFNISSIVANISQGEPREINNSAISRGGYNFVALKGGFGWKYIYNVIITKGSNTSLPQLLTDRMTYFTSYTTNINQVFSRQAIQSHQFLSFNLFRPIVLSFNIYH